jgi:putative transposase
MSRLRRIEQSNRFFFITTNLVRHLAPLSPHERNICMTHLAKTRANHNLSLFAYALMPDHAHLLLWIADSLLPSAMRDWKSATGFEIAKTRGRSGAVWQPRYFDFILRRAKDFKDKLAYIHNNPVAAGLVESPEDWPWSSAAFYNNKPTSPITPDVFKLPIDPNTPLWRCSSPL